MSKQRVIVGMSGGVDSAVSAYLLKAMGYDVIGVTLRTWLPDGQTESRCCEITEAQKTADMLDIPYYVRGCADSFYQQIAQPFFAEYLCGRTPNPCVRCNPLIKWQGLFDAAAAMHADFVATGHYAQIDRLQNGRLSVCRAQFSEKDQSYMLCRLTQEQLARTLFPLGRLAKTEVRSIAEQVGIPAAKRPESQEICFVADGSYADLIEAEHSEKIAKNGNFLDMQGRVIGTHSGIHRYTVGQRRGLGIACGEPVYVVAIDADANTVTLGPESALYAHKVVCSELHFMGLDESEPLEKFSCCGKIRYRHAPVPALLTRIGESELIARFEEPVRAATPGQTAVFYDDTGHVLLCGTIHGTQND